MGLSSFVESAPPGAGLVPAVMTVSYLADGDRGAEYSIDNMRALVDQGLKNPEVYQLARAIVQGVPAFDDRAEVERLYDWVLQHVRFVKGVIGKQSLQTPTATLALGAGQCTDLSILLASLAMSIGYPARFVAVATDSSAPGQFSHIYPEVEIQGLWVPLDAARAGAAFGIPPQRVFRRKIFNILDSVGNMPRLGATTQEIADTINAVGQSAADIITAAQNEPPYLLINGQFVANPYYRGPVAYGAGSVPVLQNTSQALGIPAIALYAIGAILLYSWVKK